MVTIVAQPLLFSHSATCMAEPTTHNIPRNQFGHAHTGPVVVGVNETISISSQRIKYLNKDCSPLSCICHAAMHTSAAEPVTQEEMGIL